MRRGLKLRNCKLARSRNRSGGYMLITLVLALALITIALLAVLPDLKQQILRDREDEMRHRGTAYMRAIQHFYKKFGRYPNRLEELENTNNVRFLRKRYTDPMNRNPETGKEKDFKILHQQDVNLNNGPVLGQAPGQNGLPGQTGGLQGQSVFGGAQGGLGGLPGGIGSSGSQPGGTQPGTASGDSANAGTDGNSSNSNAGADSSSGFSGPTFGGGPILGVASGSKAQTIRVFYSKNHYNDWLFVYLPVADRGGLLNGPVNPGLPTANLNGVAPGGTISGQGQGMMPTSAQTPVQPMQPSENSGQTPPPQN
jgi:type II secretory pathway pseudopilin PulG